MLGTTLYEHGDKRLCEGGLTSPKATILWGEVHGVFLSGVKYTHWTPIPIPTYESLTLRVVGNGKEIRITVRSPLRVRGRKKDEVYSVYEYIVHNIAERQWQSLLVQLEAGERISFGSFDITGQAVYRKRLLRGGYDIIDVRRITGCGVDDGEFIIEYVTDEGKPKQQRCGPLEDIPNLHLARMFCLTRAELNLLSSASGPLGF